VPEEQTSVSMAFSLGEEINMFLSFYIFIIKCRAVFVLPRSGHNDILEFYPVLLEGYSAHSQSLSSAFLAVSNQSPFFLF
jgi:hypothetical protein